MELLMEWKWLPNGEGFTAAGRENVYLIAADDGDGAAAGLVVGARLTRWRSRPMSLSVALESFRNVIVLPLQLPRPAGDIEVAIVLDALRSLAEQYESGESLEGHPQWQRPRPRPADARPLTRDSPP
jgi:hypothetical protein